MPDAIAVSNARRRPAYVPRVIPANAPNETLLSAPDVAGYAGIGYSTLWRHVRSGALPLPYYMTNKVPRWKLGDLRAAVAAAPRDHHAAAFQGALS